VRVCVYVLHARSSRIPPRIPREPRALAALHHHVDGGSDTAFRTLTLRLHHYTWPRTRENQLAPPRSRARTRERSPNAFNTRDGERDERGPNADRRLRERNWGRALKIRREDVPRALGNP